MSHGSSIAVGVFAVSAAALAAVGGGGAPPLEMPAGATNAFQYEGRIVSDGLPVDGLIDLEFRAFDAPDGGTQYGPTLFADGVLVTDGSFFITLDFGDFAFDPATQWMEMSVDGEAIRPRRRLVQTFELNQDVAGVESTEETALTDDTATDRGKGVAGGRGFASRTRFNPRDPGGLWGLDSDPDEGDPDENSYDAETNDRPGGFEDATGIWNTRGNEYYYKNANVGVGLSNPKYTFDVRGEGSRAVNIENSETSGTRYGIYSRTKSTSGRGVYGYASAKTGSNYGVYGRTLSASGRAVFGLASSTTGLNYGVFGQTNSISGYAAYFTTNNANGNVARVNRNADQAAGADALEIIIGVGSVDGSQYIECERPGDVDFRVHADGDVTADGTYTGGGADVAEMMHVSAGADSVEPGDVMVINVEEAGSLAVSGGARSTLVAGVYSTRPALIASERDWDDVEQAIYGVTPEGEEGPGLKPLELGYMIDEIPLAVIGIVPCKVSTENGPIRIGDLLVTSDTPGHAMRDPDARSGTIVGKALDELESGRGVIRILLSLQ